MSNSVLVNNLDNTHLVYLRDFILDEVEADIVYLQNKTIGKNHKQGVNYHYKAWYKAVDQVVFGDTVTPKTDPGPYIIEKNGEITAYACNGVVMSDGFYAQAGSKFHAYIKCDGCSRPRNKNVDFGDEGDEDILRETFRSDSKGEEIQRAEKILLKVYPNPSNKGFTIAFPKVEGEFIISVINGKVVKRGDVVESSILILLPKGIYFIKWINKDGIQTQKMIAL